jgi:hypothetical protein
MTTSYSRDGLDYRLWLLGHPDGYVVNCRTPGSVADMWVHRARCPQLLRRLDAARGSIQRNRTTRRYRRYCSDSLCDLDALGAPTPKRCPTCAP